MGWSSDDGDRNGGARGCRIRLIAMVYTRTKQRAALYRMGVIAEIRMRTRWFRVPLRSGESDGVWHSETVEGVEDGAADLRLGSLTGGVTGREPFAQSLEA